MLLNHPGLGLGDPEPLHIFKYVDFIYIPFCVQKKHWVSLAVDLKAWKIVVLDCNTAFCDDATLEKELQPLSLVMPFLLREVAPNPLMDQPTTTSLGIERISDLPQVRATNDAGVVSIFLIQPHAPGGLETCYDVPVDGLDRETRKLVMGLIENYSG